MIETKHISKCDLCFKELSRFNRPVANIVKDYTQIIQLILFMEINENKRIEICKQCYKDVKEFIDDHRK